MKTPMQEHYFLLIESKEHYKKLLKQETSVEGKQHYQGAIWAIQKIIDYIVAERMLEKEVSIPQIEVIFNQTFNNKENV